MVSKFTIIIVLALVLLCCVLIEIDGNLASNISSEEVIRPHKQYGTTLNYPKMVEETEKKKKTPEVLYRGIVERSINLLWGQEEQLLEMKVRERKIRAKTKANLRKYFEALLAAETYIRAQLDALADKFWNPKQDHPDPMKPEVIRYLENTWKKIEKVLDDDLRKLEGVEEECNEIEDFLKKAREELPVRFEDIQNITKKLAAAKLENPEWWTTTEGTTVSEWVLSLKSLRRNDTRMASIQ